MFWVTVCRFSHHCVSRYELLRADGSGAQFSTPLTVDPATATVFTDITVVPAQLYSYSLTARTAGGSATANPVSVRVPDAIPVWGLTQPVSITTIASRSVSVVFQLPSQPNGRANVYTVVVNSTESVASSATAIVSDIPNGLVVGLIPYTRYAFLRCRVSG